MAKLSVYQAINKSFILWGIEVKHRIRVYYKWTLINRVKPIKIPCVVVDYSKNSREWSILYITDKVLSCTIDDITGTGSIRSFDNIN